MPRTRSQELAELNEQAMTQTLDEAPIEAPAPPSGPPTWQPRGRFEGIGSAPLELGVGDLDGQGAYKMTLSMRLQTSGKPGGEIYGLANDRLEQARAEMLSALQGEDCWRRFQESQAELTILQSRLDRQAARAVQIEEQRLRTVASPKGQGGRLVQLKQEAEQLEAERAAVEAEMKAMREVNEAARTEARLKLHALSQDVAQQCYHANLDTLTTELRAFCDRHREELNRLVSLLNARKSMRFNMLQSSLETFALQRLAEGEPIPETADTPA